MTLRKRLYLTLQPTEKGGTIEKIFEWILILIIALNIAAIILESVQEYHERYGPLFRDFEYFSIIFFTTEYVLRIYSIVENPLYAHPVKGRLKFIASPLAIIDLLAFLPFYLSVAGYLRFLRIFRLMALFRMFKIARYLDAMELFKKVLRDRKEQLVLTLIFLFFVLVTISFAMFYAEHDAQPRVFSSIPATMWWGITTLTTVGYGDMVPHTPFGKFLGGAFAVCSVALLALPAGILSSGFFETLHKSKDTGAAQRKCPHCGGELHDDQ